MIASLPAGRELGPVLATVAAGSSTPRSISRLAHTDVTPFVDEYTSTTESGAHGRPVVASASAAPEVDDRTPVDVHAHRGADLAVRVEVLGERVEHRLEIGLDPSPDVGDAHGPYPTPL